MENFNPKTALRTVQILHAALIGGPLLFAAVVVVLDMPASLENDLVIYLPPIFLIGAVATAGMLFRQTLASGLKDKTDLASKLAAFQTSHIIRMALYEATGLVAVVICFITGTLQNMVVLGLVAVVFYYRFPTADRISEEAGLSPSERAQLNS